jgi:very-short-patch-repair endonuclease
MGEQMFRLAHTPGREPGRARDGTENGLLDAHRVWMLGLCAERDIAGSPDERIRTVAAAQQWRIARRQLRALGIPRKAVYRRTQRGLLIPLPGAVFAVGHLDRSPMGDRAAALLAVGFEAVIGHVSALHHWGLIDPAEGEPVHVIAPLGARRSVDGVIVHRTRHLPPADVCIHRGLPVCTPARALLDSADGLAPRRLERAFDQALVNRIMYRHDVGRLLARTHGRAGARAVRALLERESGTALTRSHAEDELLALFRSARFPPFEVNARIAGYEVDFLWRQHRLVVELDGYRYHSTRPTFERDHSKDVTLRAAGLDVRRFTPHQVTTNPYAIIADVAHGLWAHRD